MNMVFMRAERESQLLVLYAIQTLLPRMQNCNTGIMMENTDALLAKFNHFRNAEIRNIRTPDDGSIVITLAVTDDDGEDTDKVRVQCSGIKEKRLLVNSVLPFLDMMSGISVIEERNQYAFAIGHCDTMLSVLNAPLYVVAADIKMEETSV